MARASVAQVAPLQVEYRPIDSLNPYYRNARKHSRTQIDALAKSIQKFGFNNPILIDEKHTLIAGHGRLEAAIQLKLKTVPTIQLKHLTEAQRRAYILADNKISDMGGWDAQMLSLEMADLKKLAIDHDDLDLSIIDSDESFEKSVQEAEDMLAPAKVEATQIHGLYDDVQFPVEGVFDFPVLRQDMIMDLPDALSCWAGPDCSLHLPAPWMVQYGPDQMNGIDYSKVVLGFYTDDHRFDVWWAATREKVVEYAEKKIIGAVTPDWSLYADMPRAVRIHNIYRSRHVGRYMQEAGIKIIPNLCFQPDEMDAVLAGLKGIKSFGMQLQQNFTPANVVILNADLEKAIDFLEPDSMLVVARDDTVKQFPCFRRIKRVVRVEPLATLRSQVARRSKRK